MKNLIKRISELKKDVVFVGGVSFVHHGIKETAKDIDIVVNNLDGLYELGEIKEFQTKSPMSKSGNRAYTYVDDIHVKKLVRQESYKLQDMRMEYENILSKTTKYLKYIKYKTKYLKLKNLTKIN